MDFLVLDHRRRTHLRRLCGMVGLMSNTTDEVTPPSEPDPKDEQAIEEFSGYRGTNTLLLGEPGSGKTHSLITLIEAGIETAVLVTDPGGEETLYEAMEAKNLPSNMLHTKYIAPAPASWDALKNMALMISRMNYKGLTEIKSGIDKHEYTQFLDVLDTLSDFTSDAGVHLGPVDEWGPERALCVDSASGLNAMSMALMIGAKPIAHQGEYGVAMNAEEQLIYKLCASPRCFFVLTAHMDKVMHEGAGVPLLSVALLGQKLAPKVPRIFSDVVMTYREDRNFFWSNTASNVALKKRTLPFGDKLDPSFVQIVETWKHRAERMKTQTQTQAKGN